MKIFSRMYETCLGWARHQYAVYYLGVMSFFESVIFPIPVDVMLAPMCLARLDRVWFYALVATITSVLGGILGYLLGAWLGQGVIEPFFDQLGMLDSYSKAKDWFSAYGPFVVFVAGFAPIPYKVFTLSAGALSMNLWGDLAPFIIASFIGRAGRFYLVAGVMKLGGQKMEQKLHEIVDYLGWGLVLIAVLAYLIYKF